MANDNGNPDSEMRDAARADDNCGHWSPSCAIPHLVFRQIPAVRLWI
jgi:hypothetical protein